MGSKRRVRCLSASLALACMLASSSAYASWWWPFSGSGMDYVIDIQGVDKATADWFHTLRLDSKTSDNPPRTPGELEQEGVALENRIHKALAAYGYFDAVIEYHIDHSQPTPTLRYAIVSGKRYRIASVALAWSGGKALRSIDLAPLPVHAGDPVDAGLINREAALLLVQIGKDACLLSLDVTPRLELKNQSAEVALIFDIEHGPKAKYGAAIIHGNESISPHAIQRAVTWKEGECYNDAGIARTRGALIGSQLFSTVKVTPAKTLNDQGEAPIDIDVKERVEHTISAGANYATTQGYGLRLGWEDRNFSGDAEKMDLSGVFAQQEQSLGFAENIPGFGANNQTLVLSGSVKHEETSAYTSHDINAGALVERKILPQVNVGLGGAYLLARTDDQLTGNQNFGLISTPGFAEYDTRDNAQDAHKGLFTRLAVTPYVDTFDLTTDFAKALLTAQTYLSSGIIGKPTLALRASLGTIVGATSASLPSDLRFYAGGGGSVRGYGYQTLAPYYNGTPIGGSSLTEFSTELRLRFTESIGGVGFIDAGNAYASGIPHIGQNLYYGAGIGLRYYSALGPIRLDVALPLNGRDINDSGASEHGAAFYVSLGQAF